MKHGNLLRAMKGLVQSLSQHKSLNLPDPPDTVRDSRVALRRSLRFWDLLLYGIILVSPTAVMPVFGIIYHVARGHVVTAILCATAAMLCTAVSYGHLARAYPRGGSAFIYVGKELHPSLGYLAVWCLAMDYAVNPLICVIWSSKLDQMTHIKGFTA